MVKVKGRIVTFTGKDRKQLLEAAKKAGMTPRQWLILAIETHAQNVLFRQALDQQDPKTRIGGVELRPKRIKARREGTD